MYIETLEDGSEVSHEYKKLILKVEYDEKQDDNINFCMRMLTKEVLTKDKSIDQIQFDPPNTDTKVGITNILLKNNKILCESGEELHSGNIVEMRYEKDAQNNMIWKPIRIRRDKSDPQFFKVANNIWSTIINPITESMIKGDIDLKNITEEISLDYSDDYYVSDKETLVSNPLREFHNYIKSKLIVGIGSSNELPHQIQIMDTSIGRGGDLNKYMNRSINCTFLLGLDIAPVIEACKRYYYKHSKVMNAIFIRYDTSKNIDNLEGIIDADDNNEYNETMLNILYDKKEKVDKKYIKIKKMYTGLANHKFNIISCQFSLHYYFNDEDTLRTYLTNVKNNCKKDGYFIGCCYDGNKIFNRLKNKEPFEYRDKNDSIIYKIEKKYEIDEYSSDNAFGKEISVYMESIGKVMPEYLVNFTFLENILKEYGFEAYKPNMKPKYNHIINKPIESFNTILSKLPELYESDVELKKFYKNAIKIIKDEKLKELSSMNNYFIFKKTS